MLKTKSIEKRSSKKDGFRVCVMRRIRPEYKFDIWMPVISPSEKLLQKYVIDKEIRWDEFKPLFKEELLKNRYFVQVLAAMSQQKTVTLLCVEEDHSTCHRSIITDLISEMRPEIKVRHI
ncbi:MAG: DUF488 domain-containing protein [Candidatus Pacebacteria bacterium]|nr:DUF488 domain-containing protein [Candidatus Paceibacterota bacterium]